MKAKKKKSISQSERRSCARHCYDVINWCGAAMRGLGDRPDHAEQQKVIADWGGISKACMLRLCAAWVVLSCSAGMTTSGTGQAWKNRQTYDGNSAR